jgi:hypothetical protein
MGVESVERKCRLNITIRFPTTIVRYRQVKQNEGSIVKNVSMNMICKKGRNKRVSYCPIRRQNQPLYCKRTTHAQHLHQHELVTMTIIVEPRNDIYHAPGNLGKRRIMLLANVVLRRMSNIDQKSPSQPAYAETLVPSALLFGGGGGGGFEPRLGGGGGGPFLTCVAREVPLPLEGSPRALFSQLVFLLS